MREVKAPTANKNDSNIVIITLSVSYDHIFSYPKVTLIKRNTDVLKGKLLL